MVLFISLQSFTYGHTRIFCYNNSCPWGKNFEIEQKPNRKNKGSLVLTTTGTNLHYIQIDVHSFQFQLLKSKLML